ncbi:MAG: DinB family protein [Ilumatobacteraceae bacterium]
MPEEFEGDLAGAVFWGADLHGARMRDVDLTDVRIEHAWVIGVEIDALVERLVVNGVDVTAFVNEHDEWYPLRTVLRVTTPEQMRAGAPLLDEAWSATIAQALALPDEQLRVSVDGEWSFVETMRHLVFAIDKWFDVPILGRGFHAFGLPNTGSRGFPWPGLDLDADPPLADILAAHAEQTARLRTYLANLTDDDVSRTVEILENGPNEIHQCIGTVFEEAFWHLRYARRDLARLASSPHDRVPDP